MNNSLKKGMLYVFIANIINLVFSLLTNFILPDFLSIDSYANIKTYQLYVTYAGFVHLGFIDGVYLKYGGKDISSIDKSELEENTHSLRVFQFVASALAVVLGLYLKNMVFLLFAASLLPLNMGSYYKTLYQATGDFKKYGMILNLSSMVKFILNMSCVFILRVDDAIYYILSYVIIDFAVWFILEIYFWRKVYSSLRLVKLRFSIRAIVDNSVKGFYLMLGNFSSILLTSMDRWFVKLLLTTFDFAIYSFAVSIDSFLNVAITPITVTLYNYFCKHTSTKEIVTIRKSIIVFSTFLIALAFPASFIVVNFIPHYSLANHIIFVLFGAQMLNTVIKGIYVNLYKSRKQQNRYFSKLVVVIVLGFVLNYAFYKVYPGNISFAVATFVSTLIWFVITLFDFKDIKITVKELSYMIASITIFFLVGLNVNVVIGCIVYVCSLILLVLILMREVLDELISLLRDMRSLLPQGKKDRS